MPIIRATCGNVITLCFTAAFPNEGTLLPGDALAFTLSQNRFTCPTDAIWTAALGQGLELDTQVPGLVHVTIPSDVSGALRRGAYMFSAVATRGADVFTVASGYVQIEYAPTSPLHDIPYRSACI
jgi:hypothetical protein